MDPCRETPWPAVLFRFLSDDLMSQLSFWHLLVQYIRYVPGTVRTSRSDSLVLVTQCDSFG